MTLKIRELGYIMLFLIAVLLFCTSCTQKEKQTQEVVDTERIYLPEEIDEPPKMPQSAD